MKYELWKCGACGHGNMTPSPVLCYLCEDCKRLCYTFEEHQKPAAEGDCYLKEGTYADIAKADKQGRRIGEAMLAGESFEEAERRICGKEEA
jgi:hypothetical protein